MKKSRFYNDWHTTIAGLLVAGIGVLRYNHLIDQDAAGLAITLIIGYGLSKASDQKKPQA